MNVLRHRSLSAAGISLVETVVSVGVLAVVIPLGLAAMVKASNSGVSARGETRAPTIADYCMLEVRAARKGESGFFDRIEKGADFGNDDDFLALAFGRDGAVIGEIGEVEFAEGVTKIGDDGVFFLARVSGELDTETREVDLVTVTVDVEYPASQPAGKRSQASFHTKLP